MRLQEDHPVAYASVALLRQLVWATNKFDQYILGHKTVHIESDYQLLKAVFVKPIHKSPKRLQSMLMALQSYTLDIRYKKLGAVMWIPDTSVKHTKVRPTRHKRSSCT